MPVRWLHSSIPTTNRHSLYHYHHHLIPFVVVLVLPQLLLLSSSCYGCNQLDRDALQHFSSNISSPPSIPLNWSSSSSSAVDDCCLWEGITCDAADENDRVTRLWLPSRGLTGGISWSLENLTYLTHLNLSHNSLSGPLSSGLFSSLNRLEIIDLSYNRLFGELPSPSSSSSLANIRVVDLSSNRFHGLIESSFFDLAGNLTSFNASNNGFIGPIPSNICSSSSSSSNVNFSRLVEVLDFSNNDFTGQVPAGLSKCSQLKVFRAGFNFLSGPIPEDIYDAVTLQEMSLPVNKLTGIISNEIVQLTNIRILELYSNQLIGPIPQEIGKLSNMEQLLLHMNNLTGSLPPSLFDCAQLTKLILRVNKLEGDISNLNFSKLIQLSTLDLGNNYFTGNLPTSLYSCKSLTAVRLANNQLQGQILPEIIALQSLSFLSVSINNLTNLTGAIRILMGCKNLTTLILSKNYYNELMPDYGSMLDTDGFQNLQIFSLGSCKLSGTLPPWLAKLGKLMVVDLSFNQFQGSIPGWLGSLANLFYIDLSDNQFSGEFPRELISLPKLASEEGADLVDQSYLELPLFVTPNNATNQQYNQLSIFPPAIYLRNNSLSGNIPIEIGNLKYIHVLDLSLNHFTGNIPDQISNLGNLERLDLSGNNLSGEIPASLKSLSFLSWFSVAYNNLQGPIPTGTQFDSFPISSFEGNPGLCGSVLHRPCTYQPGTTNSMSSPNKILIVGLIIGICFIIGFILSMLALWILSKRKNLLRRDPNMIDLDTISYNSYSAGVPQDDESLVILFPSNTDGMKELTISEVLKATDNFNQANIIGCGGFGLVYRAALANGTNLAVKKLSGDMGLMEREFKAEVQVLSTAKHKNLVSLQGYCIHEGSRLLIYTYMENGSLDYWLHEKIDGACQLDWPTRLKIAQGASCGLAYMHEICEPHIVHRDIKSSNILLDEEFEAHVADFGLSRLILPYHTHVTTELVGTLGYIPPEYAQAWIATLRGDVYSFGVVMLELLTGRRPYEVSKPRMSRELVGWVLQMRSEGKQDQVFDPLLKGKGFEEEMLQVLDLACMCINQNPFKRPNIKAVVNWLNNVTISSQPPK